MPFVVFFFFVTPQANSVNLEQIEFYFGFEPPTNMGPNTTVLGRFFFHRLGPLGAWRRPRRWLDAGSHAAQRFQKWYSRAVKMHRTPDIGPPKSRKHLFKAFCGGPWGHFGHFLALLTSVYRLNGIFVPFSHHQTGFCRGSSLPSAEGGPFKGPQPTPPPSLIGCFTGSWELGPVPLLPGPPK